MNLPTGYANLAVLSTFLHEARNTTIRRAKGGYYKTARPYTAAKLEVWIIRQDELFDIMQKNREDVPSYVGKINLVLSSQYMGNEMTEAENKLLKVMSEIEDKYAEVLDGKTTYWVEES